MRGGMDDDDLWRIALAARLMRLPCGGASVWPGETKRFRGGNGGRGGGQ
jgi:hypothetical protein